MQSVICYQQSCRRRRIACLSILGIAALLSISSVAARDTSTLPCGLAFDGDGTVVRIPDAETLELDTGTVVRLIGALAPRAFDADAVAGTWPAERQAMAFMNDRVLGKRVRLAYGLDRRRDRYGRALAHVFVDASPAPQWLQADVIEAGLARAYGVPGNFACAADLILREHFARDASRGVWATQSYATIDAFRTGDLMRARNRFVRVKGRVANVTETATGTYINFGTDWRSDFTAWIAKPVLKKNSRLTERLKTLDGTTVFVRGWIERRNGPMIAIDDESQIEFPALGVEQK